jgi:hypothetical protein
MTSIDMRPMIGLEEIASEAFVVLHGALNAELAQIESESVAHDQRMDDIRGRQFQPVTLEPVDRNNFHLGHQPSLIDDDTPLESYPAVSVMCYRAQPSASSATFDHGTGYRNTLYVETLVKAGPEDPEEPYRTAEVCDKRIWRTIEAINNVLMRNQDLNGTIVCLEEPMAIISEVFERPESDINTEISWLWQAGRVEYGITKFSPHEFNTFE